jgi:hypothetical protein
MMTLLKANIKNKEVRFLTKHVLREEINKKKSIRKNNAKQKKQLKEL